MDPQGTGFTLVQLKERKHVNVWTGKKIWPFYKKKQQLQQ